MPHTLTTSDIIATAGGNTVLGRLLGISPQAISKWIEAGHVPIDRVPAVENATGIARHLIRPDRPDLFPPPRTERAA
jgi:DNA-binding transcriptional regulator YdaS (Cro superfamily)